MSITHVLENNLNVVTFHADGVTAKDIYDYSIDMMGSDPGVAFVPNIWNFTDTAIWGDLVPLDELFEDISPRIKKQVKVGFVTNNVFTGAICKRYSDHYRHHQYLKYSTFLTIRECMRWAISPAV